MNIEPLSLLLDLYKGKQEVLYYYLPEETVDKLINHNYYDKEENDLFLDDLIACVSKSNGEIEYKGKIKKIDDESVTLKYNLQIVTIEINKYYIFIKQKRSNADYYRELLKSLS